MKLNQSAHPPQAFGRRGRHQRWSANMKRVLIILFSSIHASAGYAGVAGWLTSEVRNWAFIQQTGGIRISAPIAKDGRRVLPVDYWPEGNSGIAARTIKLKRNGTRLVIQVVTQVVEKNSDTTRIHYVDLSDIAVGSYDVYYETAGDPAKNLGHIEIK